MKIEEAREMLKRWESCECQCDTEVGHICEVCHDSSVVSALLDEISHLKAVVGAGDTAITQLEMRLEAAEYDLKTKELANED
jgi:hypothetical protein